MEHGYVRARGGRSISRGGLQGPPAAGEFDYVIAVDAGFAHLEAIGAVPDMAVGDFDSLGYVPKCRRVSRHPVKKDKSDMEAGHGRRPVVPGGHDELIVYARWERGSTTRWRTCSCSRSSPSATCT